MKKIKSFVAWFLLSLFLVTQTSPVMAWKISVPDLINTGVQILHQQHQKGSTVKAPANFKPVGVWIKSQKGVSVPYPSGDYFLLLQPRRDVVLQPQETPWVRIGKHSVARMVVLPSGIRRVEFRIPAKEEHSKQLKIAGYAPPAMRFILILDDLGITTATAASGATVATETAVAVEAIATEGLLLALAANPITLAVLGAVAATAIAVDLFLSPETQTVPAPVQQPQQQPVAPQVQPVPAQNPQVQPDQNRKPGEYPCEDEKLPDTKLPDLVRQTAEENELWHIAIDPPTQGIGKSSYFYRNVLDPAILARFTKLYGGTHWEEHRVPKTFLANGKNVFLRWFRPEGSVNEYDFQFVAECKDKKKKLPILVIDSSVMPRIAQHIRAAQAQGQPRILTYLGAGSPQQPANRKAACGRFKKTTPNGSCDEYPFASTSEGGASASIMEVPLGEQKTQGGVTSIFYQKKLKSEAGAKFLVVVK